MIPHPRQKIKRKGEKSKKMEYLYQVITDFWGFWFGGTDYATTVTPNLMNVIELLSVVTTIALVVQLIVKPLFGF